MNDDELRGLIRQAIQRHLGDSQVVRSASAPTQPAELRRDGPPVPMAFGQYNLERADTMCIIEPAVQCNHCGFCKCHGH
jgi:hypothetical protein